MSSKLITTWAEYDCAVQEILSLVTHKLSIFDGNLLTLKLERADRLSLLHQFLGADPRHSAQIVLIDPEPLRRHCPRLMKLLAVHAHNLKVVECPLHLASLGDSLIIADNQHCVVRFHKDHARAKAILYNAEECAPYKLRYEQIIEEGGTPVTSTTLGL